jgi:hypothetical protein
MSRQTKPRVAIHELTQDPERATRLALFIGIMREQPEVTAAILRCCGTVRQVAAESKALDSDQATSCNGQTLLAAASVFGHRDDLALETDHTTAEAIVRAIGEIRPSDQKDVRVTRMATLACEYASWQADHPYGMATTDGPMPPVPLEEFGLPPFPDIVDGVPELA